MSNKVLFTWKTDNIIDFQEDRIHLRFPNKSVYAGYEISMPVDKIKVDRDRQNGWYLYGDKFDKYIASKDRDKITLTLDEIAAEFAKKTNDKKL